jgi:hypothetical protein
MINKQLKHKQTEKWDDLEPYPQRSETARRDAASKTAQATWASSPVMTRSLDKKQLVIQKTFKRLPLECFQLTISAHYQMSDDWT